MKLHLVLPINVKQIGPSTLEFDTQPLSGPLMNEAVFDEATKGLSDEQREVLYEDTINFMLTQVIVRQILVKPGRVVELSAKAQPKGPTVY